MRELIQLCDGRFATQPVAYWRRALAEADVPYSVVANYDEVIADPQMAANGVFLDIDDPVLGRVRTVDTPMQVEGQPKVARGPAPRVGEHTRAVLEEIGLGKQEIDALAQRRVVAEL
jgi:crotonobetainyl-CoA:carnitine CoA-transferase CaiB-like acyl-CoA transferase